MEAQKCRLCGERHHRYEPHVFAGPPITVPIIRGTVELVDTPPLTARFDRTAYMREYMRKWRQKRRDG